MPEKEGQISLFPGGGKPDAANMDQPGPEGPAPAADKLAPPVEPVPVDQPELPSERQDGFSLTDLAAKASACTACPLRTGCRGVVFGEGSATARLMLVGEGPGETEDRLGRPFVGKAGQLLDKILTAAGIERAEVYIANVVKCRPPQNRLPLPEEIAACRTWLEQQIIIINPAIIVGLGALATQTLISPEARITRVRGQIIRRDGRIWIPTFHPAALLRDESKKRPVWEDFKAIRDLYRALPSRGSG